MNQRARREMLEDPFRPFNQDLQLGELEQKYFMEANGVLYVAYPDKECFCSHKMSRHLDNYDVCLSSKCFCDHFASEENQSKGKIKKKHVAKKEVDAHDDQQVFYYIKTISKL
jgi:hypothetical protein